MMRLLDPRTFFYVTNLGCSWFPRSRTLERGHLYLEIQTCMTIVKPMSNIFILLVIDKNCFKYLNDVVNKKIN